ncbi:MAG TPA: polysaccharide deacetylase family protein [Mycobacteriales bacterium]|nr:polysaccharide deacetylase family protein [Mycobacteriales bacterium]
MRSHPLVLYYHAFGTRDGGSDPHNLFVPVEAFTAQLDMLRGHGWQPLSLAAYLAGWETGRWPRRSFLLTIDDGYTSTLAAAPVLDARGIEAVVFLPGGLVGGTSSWMPAMPDEPLLDADEIRQLLAHGLTIGVHGMDHTLLVGRSPTELHEQCVTARELLAEVTGEPLRTFAYPAGQFDGAALAAVEAAGYAAAFSTSRAAGRFAIPRIDVNATDTAITFRLKLSRWWPGALSMLSRAPRVRAAAHHLVGSGR